MVSVSDGMKGLNPNPLSAREILMRLDQVLSGAPLLLHDASRESIVRAWYDIELKKVGRSRQTNLFTRYLKHDESKLRIDSRIVIEAICVAFDCNDDSLAIFTDCRVGRDCSYQVDCSDVTTSIAIDPILARSVPCKRKIGFFTTKMEAFRYANDVPVEETSVTARTTIHGDKSYLVSLQSIASIWSSINSSQHSNADIGRIDESAMRRVAVAIDSHLRCVLDHCLSSAYDRLSVSAIQVSSHHTLSTPIQTQELDRQQSKIKCSDMKLASANRDRAHRHCSTTDRIFLQPTIQRHRNQRPHNVPIPSSATSPIRWFEDINAILSSENTAVSGIVQNRGLGCSSSSSYDQTQVYQGFLRQRVDRAFLERDNSNGVVVPRSKASKVTSQTADLGCCRELFLKIIATEGDTPDHDSVHSSAILDGIYAIYNSGSSQHRKAITAEEQESISMGCEMLWLHLPPGELYTYWLECFEGKDFMRTVTDRTHSFKRRQQKLLMSPKKFEVTDEDMSYALNKMQKREQSGRVRILQCYD